MGMIQHKTIVVTGFEVGREKPFTRAHNKAKKLFPKLVSKVIDSRMNGYKSFFVAPCGSKLGWNDDHGHQEAMEHFIEFLESLKFEDGSTLVEYVYVTFGEMGLTVQDHSGHNIEEG